MRLIAALINPLFTLFSALWLRFDAKRDARIKAENAALKAEAAANRRMQDAVATLSDNPDDARRVMLNRPRNTK